MANVIITLLVDTTTLLGNPTLPLKHCCTLAQLGGRLNDDPNSDLANDMSDVNIEDQITWNGISNSSVLPSDNVSFVTVNILSITPNTVFGQAPALVPDPESGPGATGGTYIEHQISFGSEGDIITYSISFQLVTNFNTDIAPQTSQIYNIDPKIKVHQPH